MSLKTSNDKLIPKEFPKILHDFSKEIIRFQPKDIIDFSYKYFYSLENNIPFTYASKKITNISTNVENNINQAETKHVTLEKNDVLQNNKNSIENNEIKIKKNNKNENETDNENNNEIQDLEEPEIIVPLSKEMKEFIKKNENEDKDENKDESKDMEKKSVSSYSKVSESNEKKQEIKNFISDLFFE